MRPRRRASTSFLSFESVAFHEAVVDSSWTMASLVASTTGHWTDHLVGSRPVHQERRD